MREGRESTATISFNYIPFPPPDQFGGYRRCSYKASGIRDFTTRDVALRHGLNELVDPLLHACMDQST